MLYIYSSSKLNLFHNVEMTDIGNKNAYLFFFWPATCLCTSFLFNELPALDPTVVSFYISILHINFRSV